VSALHRPPFNSPTFNNLNFCWGRRISPESLLTNFLFISIVASVTAFVNFCLDPGHDCTRAGRPCDGGQDADAPSHCPLAAVHCSLLFARIIVRFLHSRPESPTDWCRLALEGCIFVRKAEFVARHFVVFPLFSYSSPEVPSFLTSLWVWRFCQRLQF